jgi:hypothetical protein
MLACILEYDHLRSCAAVHEGMARGRPVRIRFGNGPGRHDGWHTHPAAWIQGSGMINHSTRNLEPRFRCLKLEA